MNIETTLGAIAKELGELLGDEQGACILSLLQEVRLLTGAGSGAQFRPTASTNAVGVWKPHEETGAYRRCESLAAEWRCWADVPEIPKKGSRKRIILIGESVARGYFYDPTWTPARMLEDSLQAVLPSQFEVIDLARIDIGPSEIRALLSKLHLFSPDMVICWAGNNWQSRQDYQLDELVRIRATSQSGLISLKREALERRFPRITREVLNGLNDCCQAKGIPSIVVVPEFNLGDWHSEPSLLVPYHPKEIHAEWMQLFAKAQHQLQANDLEGVIRIASRMIDLDEGLSPVSRLIRAKAYRSAGKAELALADFLEAKDATSGLPLPTTPRCPTVVQNTIRAAANSYNFGLVDLPVLLAQQLDDKIPDRRVFLDYCHLNFKGLQIAVEGMLGEVLRLSGNRESQALCPATIEPKEEAISHLLAAIHNAHYGQGQEILRHFCGTALALSPEIGQLAKWILDFQNRSQPRWAYTSFSRICAYNRIDRYLNRYIGLAYNDGNDKFEETGLNTALIESLRNPSCEQDALDRLLIDEHSCARRTLNLLRFPHHAKSVYSRTNLSLAKAPAYYCSTNNRSDFRFYSGGRNRLSATLIFRVRQGIPEKGEYVRLCVNGHVIAELPPSPAWRRVNVELKPEHLKAGANIIHLYWPLQRFPWKLFHKKMQTCLRLAEFAGVLPIYGEIFRFELNRAESVAGNVSDFEPIG